MRRLGHARIVLSRVDGSRGDFTTGTIEIDGQQIEGGIRSLTLTAGVDRPPQLELNSAIAEFDEAEIEARGVRYALSKSTREALIALGWTPPAARLDPATTAPALFREPRTDG